MNTNRKMIALLGGALIAIGSFLPWWTILGVTTGGFSTGAGKMLIVFGVLIALLAMLGKKWANITAMILGLLTAAWALKQILDSRGIDGVSIGFGIILIMIGAVVAIIGGAMGFKQRPVTATA